MYGVSAVAAGSYQSFALKGGSVCSDLVASAIECMDGGGLDQRCLAGIGFGSASRHITPDHQATGEGLR